MSGLPEKIEKEEGLFDKIQSDAMMSFVENLIPKVQPFIDPAVEKLMEYFGDDEKIFILRKLGNKIKVFILDNKKGEYSLASGAGKHFKADEESIIAVIDVNDFIQKLLMGEFTKIK